MGRWTKVLQTARIVASDKERLAKYCPDLDRWPQSWSVEPRDITPGQQLLDCFKPFLLHLLDAGLSLKTLRTHRDNLWILGGEMISDFHADPSLRKVPVQAWLDNVIGDDGGPLMREQISERVQQSFDSTCRRFYRFRQSAQTEAP
jgi:hypothetical protein